jgi:hypothetical protein
MEQQANEGRELTESESLLFGSGFGVGTDIETGLNGNLLVVSLSHGRHLRDLAQVGGFMGQKGRGLRDGRRTLWRSRLCMNASVVSSPSPL